MTNVRSATMKHNSHIIKQNKSQDQNTDSCNCRSNRECPLNGEYMKNNMVYKATVTTQNTKNIMHYIATTFKERFRNHTKSFEVKNMLTKWNFRNTFRNL